MLLYPSVCKYLYKRHINVSGFHLVSTDYNSFEWVNVKLMKSQVRNCLLGLLFPSDILNKFVCFALSFYVTECAAQYIEEIKFFFYSHSPDNLFYY